MNRVMKEAEALEIYKKRRAEIIELLDPEKVVPFFLIIDTEESLHQTIIGMPNTWFGALCQGLDQTYKVMCAARDQLEKMMDNNPERFNPGGN